VRKVARGIAVLSICAIAAGCVSPRPRTDIAPDAAAIAPRVIFKIPPPGSVGRNVTATQTVVAKFRGSSYTFQSQIEISSDTLELVALDGMGRRALTMTWNASGIDSKPAPWLPSMLRPSDILAGIALVYWPDDALSTALKNSGAALVVHPDKRSIKTDHGDIVVIDYGKGAGWNRSAHLRNVAFGYDLDIQSVEVAP
jgi:hypothetical protein